MRARSIQFRLTAWYALVLAAALGLFGGMLWLSLRQRLIGEVDQGLAASAARFQSYFEKEAVEASGRHLRTEMEEFCQALPDTDYLELHGDRGFAFRYPHTGRAGLEYLRDQRRQFRFGDETYTLTAGTSLRSIVHTLDLLQYLLLSLIPAVIAIACVGGAWLSRRALRPVDEITNLARTIGIGNLSLRLPVTATGDELQRLTEVWNTMLARIEAAVGTLSQFAADASHEIRTPLAVIRTSAELALRRARSPESYRDSLGEIAVEAERMTHLVENLLFLARSDTQAATGMAFEPLDLSDVAGNVAAELRELARLRGIEIHTRFADEPAIVSANPAAARRLFLVLMDNAIKYSHPGGVVEIAVERRDGNIAVAVRDFGIGIAPADLPHIFKRFYRADPVRTETGHGLGLSLAATIAHVHSAAIDVASVPGEGSVFTTLFPAARATLPHAASGEGRFDRVALRRE